MQGTPFSLVCLLLPKIGAGRPACVMANLQPRACRMESAGYMMRGSDKWPLVTAAVESSWFIGFRVI